MKIILAASAIALSFGTAHADSAAYAPIPVTTTAAPANSPDWTGFYAGVNFGMSSGEMFDIGGPYVLNSDANQISGFLGYRRDLGNYVIGGEISTSVSVDMYQEAFPTWAFNRVSDARVTFGRDLGRTLIYVAGGYTNVGFDVNASSYVYDGWNAGVGVDFMATDRLMIGAEYIWRSVSRTDARSWTGDFGTIQLRAGFRF